MQRRQFSGALGGLVVGGGLFSYTQKSLGAGNRPDTASATRRLAAIEKTSGGRLGVSILDTGSGAKYGYRAGERFPMCSTFKLLAAALVLHRVDAGQEQLDRRIPIAAGDILPHSPTTQQHIGPQGLPMAALCEASIIVSDNAAANLMLASFGGPDGLTTYLRGLGDKMTRLDRTEPELNESAPGDVRDTTTPDAMLATVHKLTLGSALSDASRQLLVQWLQANTTGDRRLRALLPPGWRVGDKTGTGAHGSTNDVGLIWPPGRPPLLVAAYLTGTQQPAAQRDVALAKVGQLAASLVQ
ncbi:beta-lactamase class A [Polaromonas sp. CF318]|uniref:class A beta-lactamase n=1 Tax=Polaromonas sp. CF318 TaxID=1144318 RepID=UPI000270E345|nr:class A beta-lactamase [Polaromonas sp. CF318]EJL82448.1 beta-lactamase class A [Polaromonas sp. CF318]